MNNHYKQPAAIHVPPNITPERLDIYLSARLTISRNKIQKLCHERFILMEPGKKNVKPSYKLHGGETFLVAVPDNKPLELEPESIPLNIVYEDDWLLVINKPKGMVVHPGGGSRKNTLVNALLAHCKTLSDINTSLRPGIVHRLDKDTSGLLVVAKTNEAHENLAKQIATRTIKREYSALVEGHFKIPKGTIDLPVGRDPNNRKKMTVIMGGRRAVTHYEVIEEFKKYSLMAFRLETGRTHQIRVHLKYLKHPAVGDVVYGHGKNPFGIIGQALHAKTLGFIHPKTKESCEFSAPLPEDFANALNILRTQK